MIPSVASEDRNWAIYANAAGLLVFTNIPFANVIAVLLIWFKVRNDPEKPFARMHAASALNFQLTWEIVMLVYVAMVLSIFFYEGRHPVFGVRFNLLYHTPMWLLAGIVAWFVFNIIFCIVGCMKASDTKPYRYPLAIPFAR